MDLYEATRIVFSRIQALDPEHASKIMGLLLIQDHGDKEMIRLAFGPETLLSSVILKAKRDLNLLLSRQPSSRGATTSPPPPPQPPARFSEEEDEATAADAATYLLPDQYLLKRHRFGFPYSPTSCSAAALMQNENNQRVSAAAAAAAAMMLENENCRFMGRPRMERGDFGGIVNPNSRQIYLTFPADSTFREEDVSNYFSIYGPVQDVRIPYQQKRMFGFVTFVYPETVKFILAKGNPHFVCEARVLVKPYKEKGKVPDKYRRQYQGERFEFSGCNSPTGFDSRDPFDLHQLVSPRMLYGGNNQEFLLRRKLEEQQAAAELQHAIEMQERRFMGLQLLDIKNRNFASPLATPTLSPNTFNASIFSDGGRSNSNSSQEEMFAGEDKSLMLSPCSATAAADKQQGAVKSEEHAAAEPTTNEDSSYQERLSSGHGAVSF